MRMLLRAIEEALGRHQYRYADEKQLHDAIATVLDGIPVGYQREFIGGPRDRFDFLCEQGIVIEAKVAGTFQDVLHQVDRYCARDDVAAAVIVTTRRWGYTSAMHSAGGTMHGKPVRIVRVRGMAF